MRESARFTYGVLAAIAALWLFVTALPTVVTAVKQFPPDGSSDWYGARSFLRGQNPYSPEGLAANGQNTYGHPPTTVIWFLPLVQFRVEESTLPLGIFTLLLLLIHTQLLAQELALPVPMATGILAFCLMLRTMCMQSHLHAGQVSELIAFFYLMSWYFLRRRNDSAAGVMLGLACTIKLFPGVMVMLLVARGRWRAALAAAATYLTFFAVVTIRFGARSWVQFFALQKSTARGWMGVVQNASLHGVVLRLFAPSCGNVAAVPSVAASAIIVTISAGLLLWAWWITRRRSLDFSFVAFSLLSVFTNPWVWEHYYVFYLLPLGVIAAELQRLSARRWQIGLAAGVTVTAACLMALDTSIAGFVRVGSEYRAHPSGLTHFRLHFTEVGNWIIPLLLLGTLGWIAARSDGAPIATPVDERRTWSGRAGDFPAAP